MTESVNTQTCFIQDWWRRTAPKARSMQWRDGFGIVERLLRRLFYRYGRFIALYPHLFVALPVLLTLILGSFAGYLLISGKILEDSRAWYLYSPIDAPSHKEHAVANEFFFEEGLADGELFLVNVGIQAKDEGSLLRKEYLEAVVELLDFLKSNLTIIYDEIPYTYAHLCGSTCDECELVRIFKEIYQSEETRNHPNLKLSYPMMTLNGNPYYMGEILAGVSLSNSSGRISSLMGVILRFRAPRETKLISKLLEMWGLEVHQYLAEMQHPLINSSAMSDGIISFEVRKNGMSSSEYFKLSVLVICIFVVATSTQKDPVRTKLWEGFAGVMGPILSIILAFSSLFAIGYPFVAIEMVTPFLILSIGVDDCFLLLNAWRKTGTKLGVPERMARTLEEAGPSITLTSLTNAVSFGVGVISPTPAIVYFCTFTAIGVTIDFMIQITFFAGVLVFGGRREAEGRNGYIICCPYRSIKISPNKPRKNAKSESDAEDNRWVTRVSVAWAHIISHKLSRAFVFLLIFAYWTISAYGIANLRVEMNGEKTVAPDSPVLGMMTLVERYVWKEGSEAYIFVNNPPDFRDTNQRERFLQMINDMHALPKSMGPRSTVLWLYKYLDDFRLYRPTSINDFYRVLPQWLADNTRWQHFVKLNDASLDDLDNSGEEKSDINEILDIIDKIHKYNKDPDTFDFANINQQGLNRAQGIIADGEYLPGNDDLVIGSSSRQQTFAGGRSVRSKDEFSPNIGSFMFTSGFTDIEAFSNRAALTQSWRNLTSSYPEFNATIYQINSFYADQQLSIKSATVSTILIAMIIMIVICIAFIPNAISVLSATVSMISICSGVLGILSLWDVDLDPISMASILMSVGFSVDFTCHISYHYYKTENGNSDNSQSVSELHSGRSSSASVSANSDSDNNSSRDCYAICYSKETLKSEKTAENIPTPVESSGNISNEIPIRTPEEKLTEALSVVGWPMFQVGVSTLTGVAFLAIPNTYMMNVFVKTVILVVCLGLAHGLIVLPVILTSASHLMLYVKSFRK